VALAVAALAVAGCAALGLYRPVPGDPDVVEVRLTDSSLHLGPRLVSAGKIGLELVNDGELEHGVRVVGPDVDETSEGFLFPGQRRRMWLKLGPGTYRVFCPDGDHAARGISAQLTVTGDVGSFRR
jgi:hypothetical protein